MNLLSTGTVGLEPTANGLEIRYSIHLSYAPKALLIPIRHCICVEQDKAIVSQL